MTIAIIDRHPILRTGLTYFIKDYFKEVEVLDSENVIAFQETFPRQVPDLVILGFNEYSYDSSLSLVNTLKKQYPKAPLIVYDEKPDASLIVPYLKAGVNGYLSKQNSATKLINCVEIVLQGKRYICKEVLELVLDEYIIEDKAQPSNSFPPLTPREYEVAKYLIQGIKTSGIAKMSGRKLGTISAMKTSIFKKLNVDSIVRLRQLMIVS